MYGRLKQMIEQVENWQQGNLSSWRSRQLPSVFPLLIGCERIDEQFMRTAGFVSQETS
jgi:hypothetical protein